MSQKKKPIYISIYEKIRSEILDGTYKCGDKMPSKRVLSDSFGVSVITAEHVYDLLLSEGYVESRERSGYYCIFRRGDRFLSSVSKSDELVFTGSEAPDENSFPFSLYAKAARSVLSRFGDKIYQKSDVAGNGIIRGEIAAYLKRSRGMNVSPAQIVIGSGAEFLYGVIVEILGKQRVYAAESPSYEMIEAVYKSKGVRYEMLPLLKSGIKSEKLKKTSASVLHITPYRSFPSGVTASASKKAEYAEWAIGGDRYIVEDDFESEFNISGKPYDTVFSLAQGNVIYMNTFSKTVSGGVRVAYMVLPERLCVKFTEIFSGYSCTVPSFEQYILSYLLKSGEFERHINRVRRSLKREKENADRNN